LFVTVSQPTTRVKNAHRCVRNAHKIEAVQGVQHG
jgi:hypothetical protein